MICWRCSFVCWRFLFSFWKYAPPTSIYLYNWLFFFFYYSYHHYSLPLWWKLVVTAFCFHFYRESQGPKPIVELVSLLPQRRRCGFNPWEDPLEKRGPTHSSILARRILGSRVRHNWVDFPVFTPPHLSQFHSHSFLLLNDIQLYGHYHIGFIHSRSWSKHFTLLSVFSYYSNSAMKMFTRFCVDMLLVLLGIYLEVELLSHVETICLTFWKITQLLSKAN